MKSLFLMCALSCYFDATAQVVEPDSILLDPSTYVCDFGGTIDGVGNRQIWPAKDKDLVDFLGRLEMDIRGTNYFIAYEAGFLSTAGATWRNNSQVIIYNPFRISALRRNFHSDSLKLLLKGIFLHEFSHELIPHAILTIVDPSKIARMRQFEGEADYLMGLHLATRYKVTLHQIDYIISKLVSNNLQDKVHGTRNERLEMARAGWTAAQRTTAMASPIHREFMNLYGINSTSAIQAGEWPTITLDPNVYAATAKAFKPDKSAEFRIAEESGFQYLEIKSPNSSTFRRIGSITDSNNKEFMLRAYDQYFQTLYISNDNKVFSKQGIQLFFLGRVKR